MRRRAALLAWALCVAAAPASLRAAELVAERITEANVAAQQVGGPDAIGGVGDWVLANDRIRLIVDAVERRNSALTHGGTPVDLGVRGRGGGDDQLARLFPVVNMSQRVQLQLDDVLAEVDPDGRYARLVVSGRGFRIVSRGRGLRDRLDPLLPSAASLQRVHTSTEYRVEPGEPWVQITTRLHNRGDGPARIFSYGDVWMRGGRGPRPFVGSTLDPERSPGFRHRSFDADRVLQAGESMVPLSFVAMAGLEPWPPIVYALFFEERVARGLPPFGVTGDHVNYVSAFTHDPPWRVMGPLRLLRATRFALEPDLEWIYRRRLLAVEGRSIARASDEIFPMLGYASPDTGLRGRVEPPETRVAVHVETLAGFPVTQATPDVAGRYRAVLPAGEYVLRFAPAHREERRVSLTVAAGRIARAPTQRFEAPAALRFGTAFRDGGPGRVVVTGVGETPDPLLEPELFGFRLDDEAPPGARERRDLHFSGSPADPQRVELPPGRYRLTATRGPEWEIAEREVTLDAPGSQLRVEPFALRRAVALEGRVAADLHVHGSASDDSGMPDALRLASFAAEGVELLVSSDHENLGRYDGALERLGLAGRLRVVQGAEVTSSAPSPEAPWTNGHHNAWPLRYQPHAHRHGAPSSEGVRAADLYRRLREEHGAEVIQLNHPLLGGVREGNFWTHLGSAGEPFDPSRPLEDWPNRVLLEPGKDGTTRALDFDAVELMNGESLTKYRLSREAWYALLRQGVRRTATGNSDSHGPDEIAGYPRNYVELEGRFDLQRFDAALREGRSFATNGPLIVDFRANGAGMGELVPAPDGRVVLDFAVAAASWVPVDEVRLLMNGTLLRRFAGVERPEQTERLRERLELQLSGDAFFTLEAGAPLEEEPGEGPDWAERAAAEGRAYARVAPGFVPQALANPIFVDADGDGRFTPPGLDAAGPGVRRLGWTAAALLALGAGWWWLRRQASRGVRTT